MAHLPMDHPLRGIYRTIAFVVGAAMVVFGIGGYLQSSDLAFFSRESEKLIGLTVNPAFSALMVVLGLVTMVLVLIGRNIDVLGLIVMGSVAGVIGLIAVALNVTDLNVFAFSMPNANVLMLAGIVLLTAGMYSATARETTAAAAKSSAKTASTTASA